VRAAALLACAVLAAAACAPIRRDHQAEPSQAFDRPAETRLGRLHAAELARHPGESAFRLINNGSSAIVTRGVLADLAERSLDLQYFIFEEDEAGAFVLERAIAAADRGVRVRLLLDDQNMAFDEASLARIDAHPNIEVRVFNPYPDRVRWSRTLQILADFGRLGHRMHNKVFAVDGQAAILGGRNIGNAYFESAGATNFRDVDVLASGPIVADVLRQFDAYWNDPITVPVAAFGAPALHVPGSTLPDGMRGHLSGESVPLAEYARRKDEVRANVEALAGFAWGRGTAVAEPPARQAEGAAPPSRVLRALAAQREAARSEFLMETAYFVPGERGVRLLTDLARRGVRVKIMTNSMATTDVPAVHAGYRRYREALLAGGVALHEYRVDASRPAPRGLRQPFGSAASALHAKVVVHDRRIVWIGSANFDPRSRRINTETGLMIESPELAARLADSMERDYSASHSWQLVLQDGRLGWRGLQDGRLVVLGDEPDAGFLRRMAVDFFAILPVEDLL
jgi:putative cardiolipin synthase